MSDDEECEAIANEIMLKLHSICKDETHINTLLNTGIEILINSINN